WASVLSLRPVQGFLSSGLIWRPPASGGGVGVCWDRDRVTATARAANAPPASSTFRMATFSGGTEGRVTGEHSRDRPRGHRAERERPAGDARGPFSVASTCRSTPGAI